MHLFGMAWLHLGGVLGWTNLVLEEGAERNDVLLTV